MKKLRLENSFIENEGHQFICPSFYNPDENNHSPVTKPNSKKCEYCGAKKKWIQVPWWNNIEFRNEFIKYAK